MRVSANTLAHSRLHVAKKGLSSGLLRSSFRTATTSGRNAVASCAASTSASPPQRLAQTIDNLWAAKDLVSLRRSCSDLALQSNGEDSAPIATPSSSDRGRIQVVLTRLAESGRSEDIQCILDVLRTAFPALGLEAGPEDYIFIVQQLQAYGHDRKALDFLISIPKLPCQHVPDTSTIQTFLETCMSRQPFTFLQDSLDSFRAINPDVSTATFLLLLEARLSAAELEESFPSIEEMGCLVRWCVDRGMPFDPIISSRLHQAFADQGDDAGAKQLLSVYETVTRPAVDMEELPLPSPPDATSPPMVKALEMLSNATKYDDIVNVSKTLNVQCQAPHYQAVIANCLSKRHYDLAFRIYHKLKEDNILPTVGIIVPLVQVLHSGDYLAFSERAVDKALGLYKDLDEASITTREEPTPGITAALIRMVISAPDSAKYQADLETLIFDMERRGYTSNKSFLAATKIIAEMRRVGSFAKSLDYYREQRDFLDERGFVQVLQEYCRISFAGDLEVPLITDYFSIIQHMRMRNVKITPNAYTIILHQIGIVATKLRQTTNSREILQNGVYERLVDTTRRIHHYLNLDAAIAPNAILWNQLMNTYQRLNLFRDVENLWRTMHLSGRFNQRTINILIDSSGYSGNMRFIKAIVARLLKAGHSLDAKNWDTLVEALCRNGHFGEALEVVCVSLRKHNLQPSRETIRIFAKFARKRDVWSLYKPSLESALPELWQTLPESITN
ncbi:hypothetical protein CPB83DRAFT_779768 [Crepidotus variabilis]|uniref:Pentatricopeptide repeat-containing protein n=1 Tax=Crepidotus variabilis TaxID=179855 RepID=A0A9P6EV90_9AGAR|nr:hypothetical protein CPB83DRAFT_779768 [Crepidotus variabilis]